MKSRGAIFIMPRSSKAWVGAEALWITVAGWSAAAKRSLGQGWVITSDRIDQPEEMIHYPLVGNSVTRGSSNGGKLKYLPSFIKTLAKDLLLWRKSKQWNIVKEKPWAKTEISFVWQQHDLFSGPGYKLAKELKVPLITYVHAPVVWEAQRWGVKRYIWGKFLERFIEAPALRKSDIIACVSSEVASKLIAMGVAPEKVVVSPMAVDPYLFQEHKENAELKNKMNLDNSVVIGWTGSFRNFHGLDLLVLAFANVQSKIPNSKLLLVGDGSERVPIMGLVNKLGLTDKVIFAGRQSFAKIPAYVSLFDIAVVSARSAAEFHYSPLKLKEYLAAEKPVLAPFAGDIPMAFKDNFHLSLYKAGSIEELADKLVSLVNDPEKRKKLAYEGHKYVQQTGTWDYELTKLMTLMHDLR